MTEHPKFAAIDCSAKGWGWAVMSDKGDHWLLIQYGNTEAYARAECAALNKENKKHEEKLSAVSSAV